MCILLTYSSENGRVAKSRRFSRLSRDLRFVGKLAVLPQDYRIFRIHILLNFEILYLEAYRFSNSEGLEGLKGVRRILLIFVYGNVRMEGRIQTQEHGFHENFAPKNMDLACLLPKNMGKIVF